MSAQLNYEQNNLTFSAFVASPREFGQFIEDLERQLWSLNPIDGEDLDSELDLNKLEVEIFGGPGEYFIMATSELRMDICHPGGLPSTSEMTLIFDNRDDYNEHMYNEMHERDDIAKTITRIFRKKAPPIDWSNMNAD